MKNILYRYLSKWNNEIKEGNGRSNGETGGVEIICILNFLELTLIHVLRMFKMINIYGFKKCKDNTELISNVHCLVCKAVHSAVGKTNQWGGYIAEFEISDYSVP